MTDMSNTGPLFPGVVREEMRDDNKPLSQLPPSPTVVKIDGVEAHVHLGEFVPVQVRTRDEIESRPTVAEIEAELTRARNAILKTQRELDRWRDSGGGQYRFAYERGVREALCWALGKTNVKPMGQDEV